MKVEDFCAWAIASGVEQAHLPIYRAYGQRFLELAAGAAVLPRHIDAVLAKADQDRASARELSNLKKIGEALLRYQRELKASSPPAEDRASTGAASGAAGPLPPLATKAPEGARIAALPPAAAEVPSMLESGGTVSYKKLLVGFLAGALVIGFVIHRYTRGLHEEQAQNFEAQEARLQRMTVGELEDELRRIERDQTQNHYKAAIAAELQKRAGGVGRTRREAFGSGAPPE